MSADVIRVHDDPGQIDARAWNALLAQQAQPTPFMQHDYLLALHRSGSAVPKTGWLPQFITLHRGDTLIAAAPAYLKSHSYGEYVFDWAWADAYQRHGLDYYPKLLVAVPFTPVPGSRLLAIDAAARVRLAAAVQAHARRVEASSLHLLFHDEADADAARSQHWMARQGIQFHWTADASAPTTRFEDLLAAMQHNKRKKIHQERRKVLDAGVHFTVHEGPAIDQRLWDFFHHCYRLTYRAHHSSPYLTREFFAHMAQAMPTNWVMFAAHRAGEVIGCSLIAVDPDSRQAFGRYWGCTDYIPCLHFEACYYQPLQWCIAHGYRSFEGGAQGEHKMARGLLPAGTQSAHWLAHPQFAQAVQDFLAREAHGIAAYADELHEHSPFKATGSEC
ncbi:GNAT family N-acetyltransferase [Aquabacterium sp.]|uniref:GNAT family N-acetyltransferase n=1 Tax=Aquabacterium sp. TaxID=1872578 RepID=UPI002B60D06B|nr:GNAT family N-acetyltransferase [Aquabacterium sp.]HSW07497.1 GNAT family N-acetyltransferase [Aquabacterium sp.]